jgi:hypothetical protein
MNLQEQNKTAPTRQTCRGLGMRLKRKKSMIKKTLKKTLNDVYICVNWYIDSLSMIDYGKNQFQKLSLPPVGLTLDALPTFAFKFFSPLSRFLLR